jgi:hypothetical protein
MRKAMMTLVGIATILTANASMASDTFAKVAGLRIAVGSPATGVIEIDRDPSSIPACASYTTGNGAHGRWFAVDLSTDGGREVFKLATAAFLAGKSVRVVGANGCTVNTNKEDLSNLYVL